jgi:hypothetical protein
VRRDEEFTAYVAARARLLRRSAFLLCGDWHRREDLTQSALTKVYLAWPRVRRADNVDGYVRQVLVRTYLDEQRRQWRREQPTGEALEAAGPDPTADADQRLDLLRALAALPPRPRSCGRRAGHGGRGAAGPAGRWRGAGRGRPDGHGGADPDARRRRHPDRAARPRRPERADRDAERAAEDRGGPAAPAHRGTAGRGAPAGRRPAGDRGVVPARARHAGVRRQPKRLQGDGRRARPARPGVAVRRGRPRLGASPFRPVRGHPLLYEPPYGRRRPGHRVDPARRRRDHVRGGRAAGRRHPGLASGRELRAGQRAATQGGSTGRWAAPGPPRGPPTSWPPSG